MHVSELYIKWKMEHCFLGRVIIIGGEAILPFICAYIGLWLKAILPLCEHFLQ